MDMVTHRFNDRIREDLARIALDKPDPAENTADRKGQDVRDSAVGEPSLGGRCATEGRPNDQLANEQPRDEQPRGEPRAGGSRSGTNDDPQFANA
jgi:hypothetical protein